MAFILGSVSKAKNVHPPRQAQIALLDVEEVPVTILAKYLDHIDVFSLDSIAELPKHTGINDHLIDLAFQVAQLPTGTPRLFVCKDDIRCP